MSYRIAITGKGGTGKTTVAGLLVTRMVGRGHRPVLAVDADPNTCLDAVLGVKAHKTVGAVREEAREIAGKGMAGGASKQQLLEMKIAESLVERDDFDLIAMGRSEGPGCYCYANNVLKATISQLSANYPYVVLDNEAGLENLSRRIVQKIELLVMVSDASHRGLETVGRLHDLAREMGVEYDRLAIVVNRLRHDELPPGVAALKSATQADLVIGLREDEQLAECAERGDSLWQLPVDNRTAVSIDGFLEGIGL